MDAIMAELSSVMYGISSAANEFEKMVIMYGAVWICGIWSTLSITGGTVLKERLFCWKSISKPGALRRFGLIVLCQIFFSIVFANPWTLFHVAYDTNLIALSWGQLFVWLLYFSVLSLAVDLLIIKLLTRCWIFKRLSWEISLKRITVASITISLAVWIMVILAISLVVSQ